MNYEKLYTNLIADAKHNPKPDLYKEHHHIIPRCIGGTDDPTNIVRLTARQHFLAHWLLFKIHRTSKLAYAWNNMCLIGIGQESRRQSSHLFELAKVARNKKLSEDMSGSGNHFYGKAHSEESIKKILATREATYLANPEKRLAANAAFGAGVSKKMKGVPKTKESNIKRARPRMIMLKSIKTGECIRILPEDAKSLDRNDWVNPYSARDKKYGKCPHCNKENELNSTFMRWHFNNCKEKQIENKENH